MIPEGNKCVKIKGYFKLFSSCPRHSSLIMVNHTYISSISNSESPGTPREAAEAVFGAEESFGLRWSSLRLGGDSDSGELEGNKGN